ncbi:cysteine desulfurase [Bacillaceae bacterium SIJ1]|uniref:cysteine desulfurase family protein n=1 Tax=Litoribacterium kuwaitense TaxID=1398745 RepID=UPI0013EB55DC|nr:cysteine desulfurase family protein [Litoribacterium kuwaitense]NGP44180.1 cysteine desulfurase [Litoribacterium kuwaitense]
MISLIYLDNSATTRPFPEVVQVHAEVASRYFANPASLHGLGEESERLLLSARRQVASLLGAEAAEIVFTSGGTESNQLAILGRIRARAHRGKHIITSAVEHASVRQLMRSLEEQGFEVTWLSPDRAGRITVEQVIDAVRDDTILVSLIHVQNELGTIMPVKEIASALRHFPQLVFHVDHVQGAGKECLQMDETPIDLLSISAHKLHGLKGTGVLYCREGTSLTTVQDGGGQERGLRSGTVNVAGAVAAAKAWRLTVERYRQKHTELRKMTANLRRQLTDIDEVIVLSPEDAVSHIVQFAVPHVKSEVLVNALSRRNIYVSTQSACASKAHQPSRVLLSCGHSNEVAGSALRISLSCETKPAELHEFVGVFKEEVNQLQKVMR